MYSGDEFYGDDVTSPTHRPIATVYEIRETPPADNPAARGRLVAFYQTYREAFNAAEQMNWNGRDVYVVRSDGF